MRVKLCIIVPAHWEAQMGGSQYQAKVLSIICSRITTSTSCI